MHVGLSAYLLGIPAYALTKTDQTMNKSVKHMTYLKNFGKNLRILRLDRNLSQEALAYEADLSISQISRIERGIINTSLKQIYSIAVALGYNPKDLFDFDH